MEIFYCEKCGVRIGVDQQAEAPGADGTVYCRTCVAAVPARTVPPPHRAPSARTMRPASGSRPVTGESRAGRSNTWIFAGVAALAISSVIAASVFGHSEAVPPESKPTAVSTASKEPVKAPPPPAAEKPNPPPIAAAPAAPATPVSKTISEDEKAEQRFSKLFDGVKSDDSAERIKRLEHFLADVSPDLMIAPRARVMLAKLKEDSTKTAAPVAPATSAVSPAPVPAVPATAPSGKAAILAGFWKFNEGAGTSAADSVNSKNAGVIDGASWTDVAGQKILSFDGKKAYVELPQTDIFNTLQDGNYSIAADFKPEGDPAPDSDYVHSGYGIVMKVGNHIGLGYLNNHCFMMGHWLNGDTFASAITTEHYAAGAFYHLVGIVNISKGETKIYVNGTLAGTATFPANAKTRDYAGKNWQVGTAWHFGDDRIWPARGIIRNVRLYSGVLSDAEIKALSDEK